MKINRALSIVLVALMLVAMLPTFTFAAGTGTVTISGNSEFVSAPVGTYSKLTYTAAYSDGQAAEETNPAAFSWEVTKDGAPATDVWCVDGEFIVSGGATGTYNIAATHKETGITSADFPITVTASTLYDWDNNCMGTVKATGEENGNKYRSGNFYATDGFYDLTGGSDACVKTLNYKLKVDSGVSYAGGHYNLFKGAKVNGPITAYYSDTLVASSDAFMLSVRGASWYSLCSVSGVNKILNYGEWYELCVVFDVPAAAENAAPVVVGAYLNGEPCKFRVGGTGKIFDTMTANKPQEGDILISANTDDMVMYSGSPYTGVIPSTEYKVDDEAFDIYNNELADGETLSFTLTTKQIQETAETYMVAAAKYTADGKELLAVDTKDLTTEKGDEKSITVSVTKTEGSVIKVFVFKKADISPVIYNIVK